MKVCWFAFVHCAEGDRAADRDRLVAGLGPVLSALAGLAKAVVHCCTVADDPFLRDGDPPNMVLQCYFDSDVALAEALGPGSPLLDLQDPERFPMLAHASVTHQAMEVRRFETSSARQTPDSHATYLVGYEGPAEDDELWLDHYLATHAVHMTQLPRVREVEVYTPCECPSAFSWPQSRFMQRNKVVFDSPMALTGALHSPVRARMREDFLRFPPYRGRVTHHPLMSDVVYTTAPAQPAPV